MSEKKEEISDDELDDLLDKQFEMQDQIHRKCVMKEKDKLKSLKL